MGLSAVAGIVDCQGGIRVVVEQFDILHSHLAPGERIYVLPGVMAQEPLSIEQAAPVVEETIAYVRRQMARLD